MLTNYSILPSVALGANRNVLLHYSGGTRTIGTLSEDGKTYRKVIDPRLHVYRESKSIGFNHSLIRDWHFDWIDVRMGREVLVTSRKFVLAHGFPLHFKKEGFEKQIFLRIADFGIEKARAFEAQVSTQEILFKEVA
jgi:hypothetical protein